MTRQRQIALAVVVAGAALLYLEVAHREQTAGSRQLHELDAQARSNSPIQSRPFPGAATNPITAPVAEVPVISDATGSAKPANSAAPSPAAAVAETSESRSLAPNTILENMRITIRQYGAAFGENPVGTNPEITAALHGANPRHIDFLRADGNRVNANGELVDAWGTPYFFHQLSGHEMEIRSAGPDRVMYTADDLVIK
jgi:hypothetical protein